MPFSQREIKQTPSTVIPHQNPHKHNLSNRNKPLLLNKANKFPTNKSQNSR